MPKLSINSWTPAFAGMTGKDRLDWKNVSFPRKRESSIVNKGIQLGLSG